MAGKIITFASAKGGVGKTTGATSTGHGLALLPASGQARGSTSVLLVDFDPQGQDAIALGLDPEPGVFDWFVTGAPLRNVVRETGRAGLSLLPGNSRTRTAETVLRLEASMEDLAARMRSLAEGYDYAVIDTPPSGLLQELAIRVCNALIIPVRLEALGMDGVANTLQMAKQLGQPQQLIILPTMYDKRLKEHEYNHRLLLDEHGQRVAPPVPARVAVAETHAVGKTIWEHENPGLTEVRTAYGQLIEWLTAPAEEN